MSESSEYSRPVDRQTLAAIASSGVFV